MKMRQRRHRAYPARTWRSDRHTLRAGARHFVRILKRWTLRGGLARLLAGREASP